jgi:ferredoxin
MNEDVSNLFFDEVMKKLIDAPSPVSVSFLKKDENGTLNVGTPVKINVIDGDKEVTIDANVGDNLRQVLLDNDFEVYKGLKQKLGNCGGGGQCGFCAVEVDGAWEPRSEYEDKKLKNSPKSRLSCLNNIQGSAKIKL